MLGVHVWCCFIEVSLQPLHNYITSLVMLWPNLLLFYHKVTLSAAVVPLTPGMAHRSKIIKHHQSQDDLIFKMEDNVTMTPATVTSSHVPVTPTTQTSSAVRAVFVCEGVPWITLHGWWLYLPQGFESLVFHSRAKLLVAHVKKLTNYAVHMFPEIYFV